MVNYRPMPRRRVRISNIPEDVQRLITEAQATMSVNDYVVGVLSRRYGSEWTPTGHLSRRTAVHESALVKLPEPLWAAVKQEAVPYSTMSSVIIDAIRGGAS